MVRWAKRSERPPGSRLTTLSRSSWLIAPARSCILRVAWVRSWVACVCMTSVVCLTCEFSEIDFSNDDQLVITGRTTLGSAPGAQVRIADREVSRLHAELEPTDRGTWVRDLGSRNGTVVENLMVGAALVPDGARIRVGGTDVILS